MPSTEQRMIGGDQNNQMQTLFRDLQTLGFSDYEAKAYIALVKLQPATAYEVSKEAGLPKANSYSVLESLSKKEAVQPVSQNPVRYMATAPDTLFDRIAESTRKRCERVKKRLSKLSRGPEHEHVWSLMGFEAVSGHIEEMIRLSRSHLWIKASEDALEPHREALQDAADRGVKILIILFGTHPERFQFGGDTKTWLHEGNGTPVGVAPYLITVTRDFEEAMVAELREQANGTYTRNRPLVNMADTLIRHEIYFAEIFERFGNDIQEAFGPSLYELRRKYLPRDQVRNLEDRLQATETRRPKRRAAANS
jgi:sugar-specific transcriptional regulator TrmB